MRNRPPNLDQAAEHIINILKQKLHADAIVIATTDGFSDNRVVKAFNRQEPAARNGASLAEITGSYAPDAFVSVPIFCAADSVCGVIIAGGKPSFELQPDELTLLESMAAMLGYEMELENEAVTDSLTALYNRRYLDNLLEHDEVPPAVLFIDLNDFKAVNDRFGHEAGDRLLEQISARLKSQAGSNDRIIRYGGDEFLICFGDRANESAIQTVRANIEKAFQQPFLIGDLTIPISASIGFSRKDDRQTDLRQLIVNADQSMYDSKRRYKKTFEDE
ncbi:GGDEF domain-containing protein [Paenibacillus sp. NPDC058071]|uniref:GGDEF domain-containing protein n=1 Tax=Paenibacillus sp. NPDC058071 TaxID=3346326 RepID=UPI0036DAF4AE